VPAVIERVDGAPLVDEHAGEPVVAAGMLRHAVRDEYDEPRRRAGHPSSVEDVHTIGIPKRALVHGPSLPGAIDMRMHFNDSRLNGAPAYVYSTTYL
jgi:hypothetical protein